jgi:hypothetical protein
MSRFSGRKETVFDGSSTDGPADTGTGAALIVNGKPATNSAKLRMNLLTLQPL